MAQRSAIPVKGQVKGGFQELIVQPVTEKEDVQLVTVKVIILVTIELLFLGLT